MVTVAGFKNSTLGSLCSFKQKLYCFDTLKNKNLTIKNIERNIELNKYIKKNKKLKKLNKYRHFCATIE